MSHCDIKITVFAKLFPSTWEHWRSDRVELLSSSSELSHLALWPYAIYSTCLSFIVIIYKMGRYLCLPPSANLVLCPRVVAVALKQKHLYNWNDHQWELKKLCCGIVCCSYKQWNRSALECVLPDMLGSEKPIEQNLMCLKQTVSVYACP